jgi:hypothetical protein
MSEKRRRDGASRGAWLGVIVLATITLAGTAVFAGWGGSAIRMVTLPDSHAQPAYIPGDYITYTCTNSQITGGGVTLCNNQVRTLDSCDQTVCLLSVTDTPSGTHTFSKWTTSGDAFIGGTSSGCNSSTSSTSNPVTLCMSVPNSGGKYAGSLTATVV